MTKSMLAMPIMVLTMLTEQFWNLPVHKRCQGLVPQPHESHMTTSIDFYNDYTTLTLSAWNTLWFETIIIIN